MVGSFITRGLVMVLGYAYPAYECFKTVEKNKPEIEQLLFWCQYWILVAVLTVCERIGDTFISWLPMYGEAKLAFFVYLWYPKTRGTKYVYDSFFRPYIAKHEPEIDRNLQELRVRAGDMAVLYWQKASSYGQTRIFEVLQFVASQSQARPQPAQRQQRQAGVRAPPPVPPSTRPPTAQQPQQPASHQAAPPASPKHPPSTTQQPPQEAAPPASPKPPQPSLAQKTIPTQPDESSQSEVPSTEESMQTPTSVDVVDGNVSSLQQDTVMEEAIRVTRGRLRKNRAAANH